MSNWRAELHARVDAEIHARSAIIRENQSRLLELKAIRAEFAPMQCGATSSTGEYVPSYTQTSIPLRGRIA
jgi:hypothetical protein